MACRYRDVKENDRPQWDVEVAGPLLFADIGINQLLADSLTQADADGAIRVVYEETVDNLELDSIYTIPDTSIQTLYIWSVFPYLVQPNTPFTPMTTMSVWAYRALS